MEKALLEKMRATGLAAVTTKASTAAGVQSNLLKINYVTKKGVGEVLKLKTVDGPRIFLEPFRTTKTEVPQCWRCQRLGHVSRNCRMVKRCVKCGKTHFKTDCPASRTGGTNHLKCCLCGGAHPANTKRCIVRQAAAIKIKKKQQQHSCHSIGCLLSLEIHIRWRNP